MAKFLTTNGINYVLEEIIKTAKERNASFWSALI